MHTILVLEADEKIAGILKSQLEKREFEVMLFSTTADAREILALTAPDLFLIDLNVADASFFGFYDFLRSEEALRFLPRIFIEGTSKGELAAQIRQKSRDVILKKPLRISQLLEHVNALLGATTEGQISAPGFVASQAGTPAPSSQPPTGSLPPMPDEQSDLDARLAAFIGRHIGNVVLEKEIGRGGMGAVFLGQQTTLERQVAVKVMLPDLVGQTSALARFRREALAIARLKSPHIVQVFDAGMTDDDVFYIVMEFLEGSTVDDFLQLQKRCSVAKALDILLQVSKGLEVAHNAGLIHRDLKPSNLMINSKGHVTITDFGLVREHGIDESEKLTKAGSLLGTPYYLSPEQASGAPLDPRTDQYSLGIIGYELLVGDVPFSSHNLLDILVMHHNLPLPDPRKKVAAIPEGLVQVLMRMAAKKADERFHHIEEVSLALSQMQPPQQITSATAEMPPLQSLHPTAHSPQSPNFKLTTNTGNRLSAFNQDSPVMLMRDDAEGKAVLRASGEICERQGEFPDSWMRALSINVGVVQQLQTLPGLGAWKFAQIESPDRILHIHPHHDMYEAILLKPDDLSTTMSLDSQLVTLQQGDSDPYAQIASIAGVIGLMMFDTSGNLVHTHFNQHLDLETIRARLTPLPQLLQSIPISFVGIDTTYEHGRVLLWDIEDQILFVIATAQVNKSLLTMSLASQLGMLKPKKEQKSAALSASIYPTIPVEESVSPALMKQIQSEFARSIGPIANLTMKKEAKRMGFSRKNFPKHHLHEFVQRLSAQLSGSKQADFLDKVMPMIQD